MKYLSFFLACLPAFSGILCQDSGGSTNGTWDGSSCTGAVKPVTYILVQEGETNSQWLTWIRALVKDTWRGDTVKFTAGQTFTFQTSGSDTGIVIKEPQGTEGYVTFTTTEDDKLPPTGTIITPAYAPLMPLLELTGNSFIFGLNASGFNGAKHIKFRGLRWRMASSFSTTGTLSWGLLRVGDAASGNYNTTVNLVGHTNTTYTAQLTVAAAAGATSATVDDSSGLEIGMKVCLGVPSACEWIEIATITGNDITFTMVNGTAGLAATQAINRKLMVSYDNSEYQPDDIVIQHNIFENPLHHQIGRMVYLNSRTTYIRDNFFTSPNCAAHTFSDCQIILSTSGVGPHYIENNFTDGATENIIYGSTYSGVNDTVNLAVIRYNTFNHIPERDFVGPWQLTQETGQDGGIVTSGVSVPSLPVYSPRLVFRGRYVTPTGSSPFYVAENTGIVGTSEPNWSSLTMDGQTLVDGTVTWKRDGSARNWVKNCFELKSGKGVRFYKNTCNWFGSTFPFADSQNLILVIKNTGHDGVTGACDLAENFPTCYRSSTYNIFMQDNVFRDTSGGVLLYGNLTDVTPINVGNYRLHNNLFIQISRPLLNNTPGYPWIQMSEGHPAGQSAPNIEVTNNTFFSPWPNRGGSSGAYKGPMTFGTSAGGGFPNAKMVGNIWARSADGAMRKWGQSTSSDCCDVINTVYPGLDSGADRIWGKNIIIGAATTSFPTNTVWSGCGSSAACVTADSDDLTPYWENILRKVPQSKRWLGDYRLAKDHTWRRQANGLDMGVDTSKLPSIMNLRVSGDLDPDRKSKASDRLVLFQFEVGSTVSHIPCVAEIHTAPDFEIAEWDGEATAYQAELSDISTYYGHESTNADHNLKYGLRRTLIFGQIVPLTSDHLYFYRLHCGGDVIRGSFMTASPQVGTVAVESGDWGYSYSRATDTITEEAGEATRGRLIYIRRTGESEVIPMIK